MEHRAQLRALVDRARKGGARACEVLSVSFEERALSAWRAKVGLSRGAHTVARVWLDGGRAGVAIAEAGAAAIDAALAAAATAPPSDHAGPADRMPPITGTLGIDDRRHQGIADADRHEVLQTAERALASGGVMLGSILYAERREERAFYSTREVELSGGATTYALSASASLAGTTLSHRIASRHFSDVASLPFGTDLRRRLEALATPAALPATPLPVVLDPRGMAALVRGLAPAFAANRVDNTFVGAFRGKALASPSLHVTDDAALASGLLSRAFDDRGVPPITVALLREGVVNSLLHDPETARAQGLRPTGHVGPGGIAPSNLVVRPGSRTRNVILTELKDFLVIDELPPVNLDSGRIAGEVNVVVFAGGQRQGGVRARVDTTAPVLLRQVVELAADQERSEEVDAPTVVFGGVELAV